MDHACGSQKTIIDMDKRLIKVETKQQTMEGDITEIKSTLKENRMFTLGILATSLVSAIGTIISLIGG